MALSLRLVSIFCLAILLASCGKFDRLDDGGFTRVTFNQGYHRFGQVGPLSSQVGGVLIYAYSPSYVTNLKLADETQTGSVDLPNGSYLFYAVGFNSASTPFDSNVKCGIVNQTLDGTSQNITINLTTADCSNGAFVDSTGYSDSTTATAMFSRMNFLFCGTGANTAISGFAATSRCGFSNTAYQMIAGPMSYRLVAPIFSRAGGIYNKIGTGITGHCIYASTAGEYSNTPAPRFPVGNSSVPGVFPLEVESYSSTDCSGSTYASHNFSDGLMFGPKSGSTNTSSKLVSLANTSIGTRTGIYFLIGN